MGSPGAGARVARSSGRSAAGVSHRLLRAATRELHERAEGQLAPLLVGPGVTAERVRAALGALHGFHAPLEPQLRAAMAAAGAPFALIDRTHRIARDLAALGAAPDDIARLPRCRDLPALRGAADAAGCLYVLEGAQLGGQVIARELARRLGIGRDRGASFFAGEGAGTAARWRQAAGWIDAVGDADAVVAAARATFESLSRWLAHTGVAA
jgi:heme oxygenase